MKNLNSSSCSLINWIVFFTSSLPCSRPPSAERVEELEESVWSVVRQENEREDQGQGVQNSGKTSTDVRGRDMGVEEDT